MADMSISVIMPVFNQETYVADAIRCILDQSYRDFEFIIVDDGSTDRTVETIKRFDDPRIRLICADHEGYLSALRRATRAAGSRWLARMDSDDLCLPDRLEKQLSFLEAHPECVFVTAGYGIVTPNDKFLSFANHSGWHYVLPSDITHGRRLFSDGCTVFDREIAMEMDYDEELGVESPLWYRLLRKGKGAVLEEPIYFVRWRLGSLSRGQLKNAGQLHYQVRARYDSDEISGIGPGDHQRGVSKSEKRAVYYSVAAGDFRSAWKTAFGVWRRSPLDKEVYKLILAASGFRRSESVEGPCGVVFSPISNPFEMGRAERAKG